MAKALAIGSGLALLAVSSLAAAKPPRVARDHVVRITPVTVHGRPARPHAVQEIARVDFPFSHDRIGPTLVARVGAAVRHSPF